MDNHIVIIGPDMRPFMRGLGTWKASCLCGWYWCGDRDGARVMGMKHDRDMTVGGY